MERMDMQLWVNGGLVNNGILRHVAQSATLGGAASVAVTSSLIIFTDAGTPADSNITLSTTGHAVGQVLYVLNKSATDANCVLLAASLVGANPITLASANDFTVLMFDGTSWLNIGGTAPA